MHQDLLQTAIRVAHSTLAPSEPLQQLQPHPSVRCFQLCSGGHRQASCTRNLLRAARTTPCAATASLTAPKGAMSWAVVRHRELGGGSEGSPCALGTTDRPAPSRSALRIQRVPAPSLLQHGEPVAASVQQCLGRILLQKDLPAAGVSEVIPWGWVVILGSGALPTPWALAGCMVHCVLSPALHFSAGRLCLVLLWVFHSVPL